MVLSISKVSPRLLQLAFSITIHKGGRLTGVSPKENDESDHDL